MSLVIKMLLGGDTPILYTMYDKKYDFNDLQQRADEELVDYLGTLKRGDKDRELFMEAYSNIMSGIKDGTITFLDGRYIDSTGRYSNVGKGNKDHYGLIASYIYNKQKNSKEYVQPEDKSKIKWDNGNGVSIALNRALFNSDNGNILDFIDLDTYDESSNKRATVKRANYTADKILSILNNFDQFTEYTDSDKLKYLELGTAAIKALRDGTIDSGDYMALSKFAGGLNFRALFGDGSLKLPTLETPDRLQNNPSFSEWAQENYAPFTGSLRPNINSVTRGNLSNLVLDTLTTSMSNLKDDDLFDIVGSIINGNGYVFNNDSIVRNTFKLNNFNIANETGLYLSLLLLNSKGLLQKFLENGKTLYYIPRTITSRNTGFVWDRDNNQVIERSIHDIPYLREKIVLKYIKIYGGNKNNLYWNTRYADYFKKGGIIKALTGIRFSDKANWYTGVFTPQLNHILEGLDKNNDYYMWLNDMLDRHGEMYRAAGDNFLDLAYKDNNVGAYLDLYKLGYLNEWDGDETGYNSLGILNALSLGMFDVYGSNKRTSGDWNGNGNKWKTDNMYSAITDYRRLLGRKGDYTEDLLNSTIEAFKEKGFDFIEDTNGYYKLVPIEKQVITNSSEENPLLKKQSLIIPKETSPKTKSSFNLGEFALGLAPDLIGAGRLFDSLNTNNKVARTIKKSLNPVLLNTYELYSPITGAFSEMQFKNRLAADVREKASRPFTSDASLHLAGLLDANRQATNLEYQGFLADDKEVKRTLEEALKRLEDNIARRTDVANRNRASINLTNREIAELEASRLKNNWQSRDNFFQGVETRLRLKYETNKARRDNFRLQTAADRIENEYLDAIRNLLMDRAKWEKDNYGSSILTWDGYDDYVKKMKALNKWKTAQLYGASALIYGDPYSNKYLSKTADLIFNNPEYKLGGVLRTSSMYLINKVIKNENNS